MWYKLNYTDFFFLDRCPTENEEQTREKKRNTTAMPLHKPKMTANKKKRNEVAIAVQQITGTSNKSHLVATSISTTEDLVRAKRRLLKARSVRLHFSTGSSNMYPCFTLSGFRVDVSTFIASRTTWRTEESKYFLLIIDLRLCF